MRDAFVNSLKKVNYKDEDIKINNLTVEFTYSKPNTEQPW